MPEEFIDGYEAIAYCARCGEISRRVSPWLMGRRFRCPHASPDSPHVAAIVQPQAIGWLRFQQGIVSLQSKRYHPRVYFFGDKTGRAAIAELSLLIVVLFISSTGLWALAVTLAAFAIADTLLQTTSAVFITQMPRVVLRSLLLGLVGFAELAVAFAILHEAAPQGCYSVAGTCGSHLGALNAAYFSFVTMVTVGYGDIAPCSSCPFGKLLVIVQICLSLLFLSGLFATMASWASGVPSLPTLDDVMRDSLHQHQRDSPVLDEDDEPLR